MHFHRTILLLIHVPWVKYHSFILSGYQYYHNHIQSQQIESKSIWCSLSDPLNTCNINLHVISESLCEQVRYIPTRHIFKREACISGGTRAIWKLICRIWGKEFVSRNSWNTIALLPYPTFTWISYILATKDFRQILNSISHWKLRSNYPIHTWSATKAYSNHGVIGSWHSLLIIPAKHPNKACSGSGCLGLFLFGYLHFAVNSFEHAKV